MRLRLAVPALAFLQCVAAAAQAPIPVVERTLTVAKRTVRVSLFSNRVAVLSVRLDGEQVLLRRATLGRDEYTGYMTALQRDVEQIDSFERHRRVQAMDPNGTITLHVGPDAPSVIHYSSIEVLDLATSRLVATLDDIEGRILASDQASDSLADWRPERGDRVELRSGATATVIEVRTDGTVVVEHDSSWIIEEIPGEHRLSVVLRLLEEAE